MPQIGTKRTSDYEYHPEVLKNSQEEAKKPKGGDGGLKLRMLIVGRYAGALIGKGGENFKRLREQYSVRITGLSSKSNERVLQLEGERESCINVVKELIPICPNASYPAQSGTCAFELNLLVNTHQAGSLIGKGGSRIKEICDESGGKLKVYPECLPNSNERVVSLGGESESEAISVLNVVLNTLENYPSRNETVYFQPGNTATPVVNVGPGGIGQNALGQNMNTMNTMGSINTMDSAAEINFAALLVANRDNNKRIPRDPNTDFGQVQTTTSMIVPNAMCGAIIGKAGMNVNQIRSTSGAKIDFTKTEVGSKEDRTITLTGTQEQIQIAEQMMSQYVRSSSSLKNM